MIDAYEIVQRTVSSTQDDPGAIDDAGQPCGNAWVRIEARYNDRWRTPMAGAEFKLWINERLELDPGYLKDFADVGLHPGRPPANDAERKRWDDLGTYLHANCQEGEVRVEIVSDKSVEPEIQDLRDGIEARLDGAYRELKKKMAPYREQWDRWGWLSIEIARAQGFLEAGEEWVKGLGDLLTAKYWTEIGEGIAKGFWWTIDTAEQAIDGAGEVITDAYDNRHLLTDRAWWGSVADDAVEGVQATAEQTMEMVTDGAEFIERSVTTAYEIYDRRDAILAVPDMVVSGDVDGLERFVDTDLHAIDAETADKLRYDKSWQSAIELFHDGESASIFAVHLNLFMTEIPPNFWAHMAGKAGFTVFVEAVLLIIGALLGGAGAAARIAALSARLARLGGTAARAGKHIDKAMDALRAVTRALDSFAEAATDLTKLRQKLVRSRRPKTRRSRTKSTVRERRDTEKRDGRCRVCQSTRHHTPIHKHGQVDYV